MVERKTLAERVSGIYYSHGVLCAAHPVPVIGVAVFAVLLACVPLINLPLSSNVPQTYVEPNFSVFNSSKTSGDTSYTDDVVEKPRWFSEQPIYIQQVIMKSAVSPWTNEMQLTDAIRGPLAEVFRLLEAIQNYRHPNGMTLDELCTHVEVPDRDSPLPQYNCLVVSPANFWRHDVTKFYMDSAIVSTVYREANTQVGKATLAELLFGLTLKEAGFKRYPLRNRQRVLQYAVTVVFRRLDMEYLKGLYEHLLSLYPTEEGINISTIDRTDDGLNDLIHVYHLGDFDFHDFLPLFFIYLGLFFYMYFSVKKIEMVKSKVGMALSAVFTVIASLLMSIGICLFFGLDPAGSSRGREIFPYLVVTVGLENILVLTKSVVSTPPHLDSKIRVAQGLSREGWSITKNLLTELTILTVGLFTLVPSIQEFCIFAMVGLLCDYFLQMCFFSTVLSLDMRSIEGGQDGLLTSRKKFTTLARSTLYRSRSSPRLDTSALVNSPNGCATKNDKVPKRLRLVLFWGRTRIVQRAFMLCMVVWIGGFLYSAGIVHRLVPPSSEGDVPGYPNGHFFGKYKSLLGGQGKSRATVVSNDVTGNASHKLKGTSFSRVLLKVPDAKPLQPVKWCYLVAVYNSSATSPCRLAVLPPLKLRSIVTPERAISLRNPSEVSAGVFKWNSLALALDPTESEYDYDPSQHSQSWETPYLPSSPLEVLLVMALSVISILVACYTAMVLYRCVCSRNYAQWRSAWTDGASGKPTSSSQNYNRQVLLESMPCELKGSSGQIISQIVSDRISSTVACSYLSGEIDVWCYASGEKIACIDRLSYFNANNKKDMKLNMEEDTVSDYESGSPPPLQDRERYDHDSPTMFDGSPGSSTSMNPNDYHSRTMKGVGSLMTKFTSTSSICSEADFDDSDSEKEEIPLNSCPQIWCMDAADNLIVVGTSSGRLEFWEASTGHLKYIYDGHSNVGVTCVKLTPSRVVVARLDGVLDLLTVQWPCYQYPGCVTGMNPISIIGSAGPASSNLPVRPAGVGHWRTASAGSVEEMNRRFKFDGENKSSGYNDETREGYSSQQMSVVRVSTVRAHQQTIMVVASYSDRVVTGSTDHTLRVFSLVDESLVFTLHGHCGPVTTLFIDVENPLTAGSGAQDGSVCLWDLLTGACVYCLEAHDGAVAALTYSSSYVLSLGTDDRLCVWDRFHGHLLNTIQMEQSFCSSMVMLTHNLLITSKQGSLILWDVRTGEPVRLIKLGRQDSYVYINNILPLQDHGQVICDYANSLIMVRFPFVRDKTD
ncbi:hypothetical protein O3M35_002162 [Rhynocoris fuscipes]|uniref:Sterol regulatory element-binding protein cleavage-activating protein n=1 Tax=Rhynocoris fuscipes TaxID=488301 RepID=A0AAW1CTE5_9HEMI